MLKSALKRLADDAGRELQQFGQHLQQPNQSVDPQFNQQRPPQQSQQASSWNTQNSFPSIFDVPSTHPGVGQGQRPSGGQHSAGNAGLGMSAGQQTFPPPPKHPLSAAYSAYQAEAAFVPPQPQWQLSSPPPEPVNAPTSPVNAPYQTQTNPSISSQSQWQAQAHQTPASSTQSGTWQVSGPPTQAPYQSPTTAPQWPTSTSAPQPHRHPLIPQWPAPASNPVIFPGFQSLDELPMNPSVLQPPFHFPSCNDYSMALDETPPPSIPSTPNDLQSMSPPPPPIVPPPAPTPPAQTPFKRPMSAPAMQSYQPPGLPFGSPLGTPPPQQPFAPPPRPAYPKPLMPGSRPPSRPSPLVPPQNSMKALTKCTSFIPAPAMAVQFYSLLGSSQFHVCSFCYENRVQHIPELAQDFVPVNTINYARMLLCDFCMPSALTLLYTKCMLQKTTQPLLDLEDKASKLAPCPGQEIVSYPRVVYKPDNASIKSLCVCEICYERFFRHTVFSGNFKLVPDGTFGGRQSWTCDMVLPFYQRLASKELEGNPPNWPTFVEQVGIRLKAPPCPGPGVPITQFPQQLQGIVFSGINGNAGNICLACFCDSIDNTPVQDAFGPAQLAPEQAGTIVCDLAHPYSKLGIIAASHQNNIALWTAIASLSGKLDTCPGRRGIDEAELFEKRLKIGHLSNWYAFSDALNLEICPACYHIIACAAGAQHLFTAVTRPPNPGAIRMCCLTLPVDGIPPPNRISDRSVYSNTLHWRSAQLLSALQYGSYSGDWDVVIDLARQLANEPLPCGGNDRGFTPVSRRRFFGRLPDNIGGTSDCSVLMCEECWRNNVNGTPYGAIFSTDLTTYAYSHPPTGAQICTTGGVTCQTYSQQTRNQIRNACISGNLPALAKWWNLRWQLMTRYVSWLPSLREAEKAVIKQTGASQEQIEHQVHLSTLRATRAMRMNTLNNMQSAMVSHSTLMDFMSAQIIAAAMSYPGGHEGKLTAYQHYLDVKSKADTDGAVFKPYE